MSVYLRKKIWWLCYADADGRVHRESAKTRSKKEAEYILACKKKAAYETKTLKTNPMAAQVFKTTLQYKSITSNRKELFIKCRAF